MFGFSLFSQVTAQTPAILDEQGQIKSESFDYNQALEIAQEKNDTAKIDKLLANGSPPYCGKDVPLKSAAYLTYLTSYMGENPAIHNRRYQKKMQLKEQDMNKDVIIICESIYHGNTMKLAPFFNYRSLRYSFLKAGLFFALLSKPLFSFKFIYPTSHTQI
ncbi:hypothetical protein GH811_04925 [Acetobacterium malicum]|uniref:Uncharacterized protein n=1 Tax=Acetobacterium malicum TaxID=52692 RepID=A0ABR6YV07_9FIRM|nr:hypothetical protein [Acetobacterium malicum]MBC3898956.1 hypothetical protein [Acetobacterium malicum]